MEPVVNYALIFYTKVICAAFFYLNVTREKLPNSLSCQKGALKTLMKLTPDKRVPKLHLVPVAVQRVVGLFLEARRRGVTSRDHRSMQVEGIR